MIELHLFKPNPSTRRETNLSSIRWSPPLEGTVFINVDATIFSSSRQMGIRVVIRNQNGQCINVCSELQDEVTVPEIAKSLALHCTLALAGDKGFCKLMVVSDCLSVIQRVQSRVLDQSHVGVVIRDIKDLANNFSDISFRHVRRQCNGQAHILGRSAERFIFTIFINFVPDCIRQTLCNDLL
jgi:hypothetical protein